MVKVLTTPAGAEVFNNEGKRLGYTPATLTGVEVDSILELQIKAPNRRDLIIDQKVVDEGNQVMILDRVMYLFSPPKFEEIWTDALGNDYKPYLDLHKAVDHVSEADWELYLKETNQKQKLRALPFDYSGRKVVAVPEAWATQSGWRRNALIRDILTSIRTKIRRGIVRSFHTMICLLMPQDFLQKQRRGASSCDPSIVGSDQSLMAR
jgi:hypothetical protein